MTHQSYQDWKQWAETDFGVFSRSEDAYFTAELRRSGAPARSGMRVLEIGFGNGAFAGWAATRNVDYRGTERNPVLVKRARMKRFIVCDAAMSLPEFVEGESIDLVVAFDVFEHLELSGLTELLRTVRAVLRVGGRVIARVPSGDSPFARSLQHGDVTHCLTLGSSAVRQLACATGYEVDQVRAPVLPLVGHGLVGFVRRSVVSASRAVIYPIIGNLLMGGGAPVLSPNLLFVLRRPGNS